MKKIMCFLISLFLISSCCFKSDEVEISFFEDLKHTTISAPILTIYCQYDECGEWGGHEEIIEINRNDYQDFTLKYVKYDVNCDSMLNKFDGKGYVVEPLRTLNLEKNLEMTSSEKENIYKFCNEMIKSKFGEQFPGGHAGIILSITNYDSTFHISTYGNNIDPYEELLKKLKL